MKKAAVMLCPLSSMQEVSCTAELFRDGSSLIITAISPAPLLPGRAGDR